MIWKKISKSSFFRNVSVLVSGTAFAQGIVLLSLPLLTRLYEPEDFSLLAVYAAILGMGSVIACLRLDIAIPLPEKDEDGFSLLLMALILSALISIVLFFPIYFWPNEFAYLIRQPNIKPYLWLLPVGVWLASSYSALQNWAVRKNNFATIAKIRMAQAILGSGTQVSGGLIGFGVFGLLFGQLILSGAGVLGLFQSYISKKKIINQENCFGKMKKQFLLYKDFPKYSVLDAFSNVAAIQLPMIIIAAIAVSAEAGYLMLAMRVMSAPMALIGGAVSQVYLSRAPNENRVGNLSFFTMEVIRGLLKIGVGPIIFIGIIAPDIFPFLFGAEWERSGQLVRLMVPWMVLQFIASPISMSMHVLQKQSAMLILTVFGLALRLGLLGICYVWIKEYISEAYIFSGAVFYAICLFVFLQNSLVTARDFFRIFIISMKYIAPWVVFGFFVVKII